MAKATEALEAIPPVRAAAQKAQQTANEGVQLAKDANAAIPPVRAAAQKAQQTANEGVAKATEALEAIPPVRAAAQKAQQTADKGVSKTNQALQTANTVNNTANNANTTAQAANAKANQALNQPRTRVTITPSTGITKDEAALTKFINTTVRQATGITAEQAKAEQIRQQTIIPQIVNNTIQQSPLIKQIQQSPTNINSSQIPAIQQDLNKLKQRVTEGEKVNQKGLEELTKIGTGLAGITVLLKGIPDSTVTKIKAPLETIARQTTPDALANAAATGTCRTTQPGGCTTKAINQGNQSLQDWIKQNLGNLVNAGDTAIDTDTNLRVRNLQNKLGTNKYPMILPEYLLDDYLDKTIIINDQVDFQVWSLKQWDALIGLFPIKIERTDENGNKQMLKFENIAEAIAEITGLLAEIAFDADTSVNVGVHATAEAIGAKTAALQAVSYVKAVIDYMGFQGQATSFPVPISVTPGAVGLDGKLQESELGDFLKPSTQQAIGFKNTDPVDMRLVLRRILEDGEIARAALYRPLKPDADNVTRITGDGIKEDKVKEKEKLDNEWDKFIRRMEEHATGTKTDIDTDDKPDRNTNS
ncbi:hypothetical protein BWI75_24410 [Gloeocapsopsis sp. AAB1 = 1H9]|uniref:Uncharacterized protein n=1 Tax=Gloeocapsopsis dulcis AAB1 = 1H9 TaxID=1433147 RepID=A0A6N8G1Y6_9CHRO|nr:hypothetical protein [Gloeocapsopsis dulcis AAB1 = 1H9]